MKKININGRFMEEKIKYGWTISGLAQHFEVSEEDFTAILYKKFSRKAVNQMLSRLRKNEKKLNSTKETTNVEEIINSPTSASKKTIENTTADILDSLMTQKTELENLLNSKELMHKKLAEKRSTLRNSISASEKQLLRLKKEVSACKSSLMELVNEYDEIHEQMQELDSEISETRKEVIRLVGEIDLHSKIIIYIFESGELSFEYPYDIDIISSDDWKTSYENLLNNEELENLTVKQIKILAQCLAYIKYFTEKNISYEFIFENDVIEEYFKGLVK